MEQHDPKTRLDLTKKLLGGIRLPKSRPEDFDPRVASDEDLKLYGLPPRPDKATQPKQFAKWEDVMGRKLTFVSPTFKIVEDTIESTNWCGAVNTNLGEDDSFWEVSAEWEVPNQEPSKEADGTYKDGKYRFPIWVGIDGTAGSHDVLQCGTGQRVEVIDGQKNPPDTFAWFEWYPAHMCRIEGFDVQVGDMVWCLIAAYSNTEGAAFFFNERSWEFTSVTFDAPDGTQLKGNSAEWIVEDPAIPGSTSHPKKRYPMGNFGHVTFYSCWAITNNGDWKDLADANVEVMVQDGSYLCVANVVDPSTLIVDYRGS
jgi:hypothetical protein